MKSTATYNLEALGCTHCQKTHSAFLQHPMLRYDGGYNWLGTCVVTGALFLMDFTSDYIYPEAVLA